MTWKLITCLSLAVSSAVSPNKDSNVTLLDQESLVYIVDGAEGEIKRFLSQLYHPMPAYDYRRFSRDVRKGKVVAALLDAEDKRLLRPGRALYPSTGYYYAQLPLRQWKRQLSGVKDFHLRRTFRAWFRYTTLKSGSNRSDPDTAFVSRKTSVDYWIDFERYRTIAVPEGWNEISRLEILIHEMLHYFVPHSTEIEGATGKDFGYYSQLAERKIVSSFDTFEKFRAFMIDLGLGEENITKSQRRYFLRRSK